jgi:AraC-like DNA-binding protein
MSLIFILYLLVSIILLVFHYKKNKGIIFLIYAIIIHGIRQIQLAVYLNPSSNESYVFWMTLLNFHIIPFVMAGPPLLYLYLKSVKENKIYWQKSSIFHFVPALLMGINYIPYFTLDYREKTAFYLRQITIPTGPTSMNVNLFLDDNICKILPFFSMFVYLVIMIWKFEIIVNNPSLTLQKQKIKKFISSIICFYVINWLPYFLIFSFSAFHLGNEKIEFIYKNKYLPDITILTLFSLSVPLSFFLVPSFTFKNQLEFIKSTLIYDFFTTSEKNKIIDQKEIPEELTSIINLMKDEKRYLKVNLSLNHISQELGISQTKISFLFQNYLNTTFPKFKNKLRVYEAIDLLENNQHKNLSIEGVAIKAGFKNKSTFYIAFKNELGMTPLDWIKNQTEKNSNI